MLKIQGEGMIDSGRGQHGQVGHVVSVLLVQHAAASIVVSLTQQSVSRAPKGGRVPVRINRDGELMKPSQASKSPAAKRRPLRTRGFMRKLAVFTAGLVAGGVLVGTGSAQAATLQPASVQQASVAKQAYAAARPTTAKTLINCGYVTCSLYLSRAQTQQLNTNINLVGNGGIGGLAASCGLFALMSGPASVVVTVACGIDILTYGAFLLNAISRAAGNNGCLRVRYVPGPVSTLAFYDDHSGYCHNT